MSKTATTAWNDLYYWRLDPETWAKKIDQAMKYFGYMMAQKYPEFRWCHGDWKVQEFATHRYPGWNRYHRQSGQLKRRVPSIIKRKAEDDNNRAPKMKKRRKNQAPPPNHEIIDLDSEAIAEQPVLPIIPATHAVSQFPVAEPAGISTLKATPIHGDATSILGDATSSILDNTLATSILDDATSIAPPILDAIPTLEAPPILDSTTLNTTSILDASSTLEVTATADISHVTVVTWWPGKVLKLRDLHTEHCAGLSIPAPPNEVPQTNTQPTGPTLPKVPTKPKKPKVLEPSRTLLTARNLYAIFYKETHPDVTEAEFREVYKKLDKETVKKYEAQGKKMKAAAGKTATAAAQGDSGDT
ncbi:hypothetical protein BYT27DRAFT_7237748 [Phlegmacium glaucopus]|nr:hypothetical protein BYT27DRAFT_7237748 [Phlegmacium glaucopus]